MIQEIIRAFLLIFIAEMGDKTQILAMAFATRYPVRKVLIGIGIGSFLNHGLAVLLGSLLSTVIPVTTIQMVAGGAFIFFALWTLKSEDEGEDEEDLSMSFGPVPTVALAFFLGELGDKTQLTAITLAADAQYPYFILVGTVAGMIATGGLGIFVGKKMGDNIPEIAIKLLAATVFLFFGLQKLYQTVPARVLTTVYVLPFLCLLLLVVFFMTRRLFIVRAQGIESEFMVYSRRIHDYNTHIESHLMTIESGLPLEEDKAIETLVDTLFIMNDVQDPRDLKDAVTLLRELEFILLGRYLKSDHNIDTYFDELKALNPSMGKKVAKAYRLKQPVEDRIINLGNEQNNIYMVEVSDGYMLIDTGYENQYSKFLHALVEAQIYLEDITYIFITHAHHTGFLSQLLMRTKAHVILHPLAAERMKLGEDTTTNHYTSRRSRAYYYFMNMIGRGPKRLEPINSPERYIILSDDTRPDLEGQLNAEIITLPGHSRDSIGIIIGESAFFCGDALMNRATNRNLVAMRIEDLDDYKETWSKMLNLTYNKAFPSHGKAISKNQLLKFQDKLIQNQLFNDFN